MPTMIDSRTFLTSTSLTPSQFSADSQLCAAALNQRSTWDILWGCLATIFACSWVSVHPNIPAPNSKWWQVGLTRLELMTWTIVAPELILFWAARQWVGAWRIARLYQDRGWTKTHGYFIQMGGFVLINGSVKREVLSSERFDDLLAQAKIAFPEVTEEDIQDRSKGDGLSKGLVVVQTTWFIAQYIGRVSQGLSVTQLELVTLGLASLNSFMYFFWWNKPLDIRLPMMVHLLDSTSPHDTPSDLAAIREAESFAQKASFGSSTKFNIDIENTSLSSKLMRAVSERIQVFFLKQHHALRGRTSVPMWYASGISSVNIRLVGVSIAVIGIIFGSIHCLGWNLPFPSTTERGLWRVSSLIVLMYPASTLLAIAPMSLLRDVFQIQKTKFGSQIILTYNIFGTMIMLLLCVAAPFYVLARLFLIAEAITALRHLPVSATSVVKWSRFLPHI